MIALAYIPIALLMAWNDAHRIGEGKKIRHWLNGLIHLIFAFIFAYFTIWINFVGVLLVARVVFDSALSLFRHLSLGYVSKDPASFVDKIEKKVFGGNVIVARLVYIMVIIAIICV